MEEQAYSLLRIGPDRLAEIRSLFAGVFCAEPWNDDWSDGEQLDAYLLDLAGQSNSLTYALCEDGRIIGLAMGHIRHWFAGSAMLSASACCAGTRARKMRFFCRGKRK